MRSTFQIVSFLALLMACDSGTSSKKNRPISETTPSPIQSPEPTPDPGKPKPIPDAPLPDTPAAPDGLHLRLGLSISKADFLRNVGSDLAVRATQFHEAATQLKGNVATYCEQFTPETLVQAQEQWKIVMSLWQHFEVFQVGPVADQAKSLKYSIYAWPDPANYCKIDEESIKASKTSNYQLPPNNNRKGLQAFEYLLFEKSLGGRCKLPSAVAKEWEALSTSQKWQARCAYLNPLAADLANRGEIFSKAWGKQNDNAISRMIGDPDSEQNLIQNLYENLFYIDLEVKNKKVAAPAGLDPKYCPNSPAPCLDKEEFPFANFSRAALDQNLQSFVDLMFGPNIPKREGGFSALLRAEGRDDVADRSESQVSELAKLIQDDAGTALGDLITKHAQENCAPSSSSWLCRLRLGIRDFAGALKNEYTAILKVKAPEAAQGDND